jgi:hypothetical protein
MGRAKDCELTRRSVLLGDRENLIRSAMACSALLFFGLLAEAHDAVVQHSPHPAESHKPHDTVSRQPHPAASHSKPPKPPKHAAAQHTKAPVPNH